MNELTIDCLGLEVSNGSNDMSVKIQNVDMGFLEDVSAEDIIRNHDNKELLEAMDSDEVIDYLEANYDVQIIDKSREVD